MTDATGRHRAVRAARAPLPASAPRVRRAIALEQAGGGGSRRPRAFSLIELVIVVTILAIIASIALRRVSGYADQSAANAAAQDVSALQLAIERYRAEHGDYPATDKVVEQLTMFTDVFGATSGNRTAPFIYGPYVRKIPPVPLGPARGSATVAAAAAQDVGWIYDETSGEIKPNE